MRDSDDVLFDYISAADPQSDEDLKRYLRRYPEYRDDIINFTATWRALEILDKVAPPTPMDPLIEQRMLRWAKAHMRSMQRRRAKFVSP